MIARVLHVDVGPDRVDAVVSAYRETIRPIHAAAGPRQHSVFANKNAAHPEIIGVWDSHDAITAIGPTLEPARKRLWSQFGYDPLLAIYGVGDELRPIPAVREGG